jgi:hypothetical protein
MSCSETPLMTPRLPAKRVLTWWPSNAQGGAIRVQANVEGGLSERARRRAMELADDRALRLTAPKLKPTNSNGQARTLDNSRQYSTGFEPVTFGSGGQWPIES